MLLRKLLALLLVWATQSVAEQPVLRFSVAESWSMPLVRIEDDQPVEGLVYDLVQALAREAGVRPQYHVMARLRLQEAMNSGDIDVRCYVSTQWFNDRPGTLSGASRCFTSATCWWGALATATRSQQSNCRPRPSVQCWGTPIQPCNPCWTKAG